MLGVVVHAEVTLAVSVSVRLGFSFSILLLTLGFLLPTDLVQTFSEQDHVRKHGIIVELVLDLLGDIEEVKGEYFVHFHVGPVRVLQGIVVPLLVFLLAAGAGRALEDLQVVEVLEHGIVVELDLVADGQVHVFLSEASRAVERRALAVLGLEVIVVLRVASLESLAKLKESAYILSRTTSASARRGRVVDGAVGALAVLLLHVRVESGIRKVGFVAVLALVVAALHVVLGSPLGFALAVFV